ncbi:hypothetical protein ACWPKS_04285 [Coraliomargarita sp. W4R72]
MSSIALAQGSGIVSLQISKAGDDNLPLNKETTLRLDIMDEANYERLLLAALTEVDLGDATLMIDSGFDSWAEGMSFQFIDWGGSTIVGMFDTGIILPEPDSGPTWDTSELYTTGNLNIIPEPRASALVTSMLAIDLTLHRRWTPARLS